MGTLLFCPMLTEAHLLCPARFPSTSAQEDGDAVTLPVMADQNMFLGGGRPSKLRGGSPPAVVTPGDVRAFWQRARRSALGRGEVSRWRQDLRQACRCFLFHAGGRLFFCSATVAGGFAGPDRLGCWLPPHLLATPFSRRAVTKCTFSSHPIAGELPFNLGGMYWSCGITMSRDDDPAQVLA